ncbi:MULTISPECIES: glycine betaine ABC transporter substrate-binding protein [Pseudomonas]|uniref:Glycine/betaine ABC transporter substrate-binding protein n=2 Tax=Pseudomonadaceae TaxID=135621 RepID=A0A0D0J4D6_9PSED|nr:MULTISPECIES: glycine betaine ABC transporter substrate-binding protein [Pseudomonas]KIQ00409.1 glycine/betaine ABC transporter substrate-binding protein [Pseudomonas fulva]MCW2291263.1 glycine betaine/proline transport system substrate-binding protein [Pseudomonas sp. BIGb0408]NYH74166.1 glycine betaine/proline transport system substrate-binding protein [Pseudomonas flavescens]
MLSLKDIITGLGAATLSLGMAANAVAEKPELSFGFVNGWDDSVATTHVVTQIIHEKLGYPVKLQPAEPAIMWQGVARGDLDVLLSAWLPATHGDYYEKFKDKVEILGTNYEGARIGLVVPDYMDAKSIEDLNGIKSELNGQITGIDAGAGIMRRTEDALKQYELDYRVMPSSGPAMTIALSRAIRAEKPIVVTGWVPHWMFAKWKLHFLDDPKKVFGDAERVDTVINPTVNEKAPEVVALLKRFTWTSDEVGAVMLAINEGAKPEVAARDWIAKNPERVAEWLK